MPIPGPREWREALIEVPTTVDQLDSVRVVLNGQALPVFATTLSGGIRVVATWPLSGTGNHRLTTEVEDRSNESVVVVRPEKISQSGYASLVEDLQTRLPASIALHLQHLGALAGLRLQPPAASTLAAELLRLRRAIEGTPRYVGLAEVMLAIQRDPHSLLRKTEQWVPTERLRRLEPVGLLAAVRRPNNVAEGKLQLVPDIRVEHTVDVYENQLLRSYYEQAASRLRRLRSALAARGLDKHVVTAMGLIATLDRARRASAFLDDVSPARRTPNRTTMVLLRRPEYRSALAGYLEFRRSPYVDIVEEGLEAPLQNLPKLYESWATLHVIDALLAAAEELGYRCDEQQLARHADGGVYIEILRDGRPAILLSHPDSRARVVLTPQRHYGRRTHPRSISFLQKPDISISFVNARGDERIYLFDPKYKLQSEDGVPVEDGIPKKIDIDTMHAYRDAIRLGNERIVEHAAIIYPGSSRNYGHDVAAISAQPDQSDDFDETLRRVLQEPLERVTSTIEPVSAGQP